MIDKTDKKTIDAFSKRRGRPPTGVALTPAERKRAQRQKARRAVVLNTAGKHDLKDVSAAALVEQLGKAVSNGHLRLFDSITAELKNRARSNFVTVTKK